MKLYYRKYGKGPVLVILHGLYGSSDNWVTVAGRLSERFTIILPDLRNHGRSPHSHIHTYDSLAEDILELLNNLGLEKVILAGHSMGGKAAMRFAINWPERIYSLVVIDISPFGNIEGSRMSDTEHKAILDALSQPELLRSASREEAEKILSYKIDSGRTRAFLMKSLKRGSDGTFTLQLNTESLMRNIDSIRGSVLHKNEETANISGFPVTFVKGENSDYLLEKDMAGIRRIFSSAELVVVERSGHWVHSDRQDAIEEIMIRQLEA